MRMVSNGVASLTMNCEPHRTELPGVGAPPHIAESPPANAELPGIGEPPHIAELGPGNGEPPHMAESGRKALSPHTTQAPHIADCPHGVVLSARKYTLPLTVS